MVASSRGFVGVLLLAAARERRGHKAWGRWVLLLFLPTLCGYMVASSRCFVGWFLVAVARKGKDPKQCLYKMVA